MTPDKRASEPVFLDANVLIYALDETSELHTDTVNTIQSLIDFGVMLCSSHHVVEEVLHIVQKIQGDNKLFEKVIDQIDAIPNLVLIEPPAHIDFARRYASLAQKHNLGVNDALIAQLMLDAEITQFFTYDNKLLQQTASLDITSIA